MGSTSFHIDGSFKLFGQYYHTLSEKENVNPFLKAHRTTLDSTSDQSLKARYDFWKRLDAVPDLLAANAADDKFIPLNCQLVIPKDVGTAPHPLAVFIHGQSSTYFDEDDKVTKETLSYRGYRYLQEYLAEKGVASISVNVNVASFLEEHKGIGHGDYEPQSRIQISFLVMAALKQLADAPVTKGQVIFFKKSDNSLVPLQDALALTGSFGVFSQERKLMDLKKAISGKLSFTSLGFMGHSRGGDTVQILQPYFTARDGTAPTDYTAAGASTTKVLSTPDGIYNTNTRTTGIYHDLQTMAHQYHYILDIAAIFGSPKLENLKSVVALQPSKEFSLLDSASTFFLVIASSHDEDVHQSSFNSYEQVNCPKAMIFSHGATHVRFNTVWRRISGNRKGINEQIKCQSPIRILSNSGHENLANALIGNTLLAGLLGEDHRYKFYTGEIRAASIGQDLERAWKFPYKFTSPPGIVLLDARSLTASNTSKGTAVTVETETNLGVREVNGNIVYANSLENVKVLTRPANENLALRIPIEKGDKLVTRTHFSFRYTKEYDAKDNTARKAPNLRNYTLRLKKGTTVIGSPIEGKDVPSLVHPAYPVRQTLSEGPPCMDNTHIILQTAEVPFSQFLGTQPVTDLNQVDTLEITMNGSSGAGTADETWLFLDFLLTTRDLPAAPAGFEIP